MKKYIFGAVLSLGLLISPAFTQAAALTTVQANSLIAVVQSSPSTPAINFVNLITAFSGITVEQATSLIAVVQSSPSSSVSAFVDLLIAFTNDTATTQTLTTPTITSISPTSASAGTVVTINGTNLSRASIVEFYSLNGQHVGSLNPSSVSATSVVFTMSSQFALNTAPGNYQVGVIVTTCTSGCNSNRIGLTYTVTAPAVAVDVKWGPQSNTPFNAGTSVNSFSWDGSCYKWTTIECGSSNVQTHGVVANDGMKWTGDGVCSSGLRYSTDFGTISCPTAMNSTTNSNTNQLASALEALDSATNAGPSESLGTGDTNTFHYVWNNNLQIGSSYTEDVKALQTALSNDGEYTGEISGGFYNQTFSAVKAFQQKYGIDTGTSGAGFVGSKTRAKLNTLY